MTARDRVLIVAVLVVGALIGSWMLIIQPKRQQAAKLGTQVTAEQSQLDSLRSQVTQGQAARRKFASAYTEMVKLGEAVPPDDNVPSLIYQIQNAAGASAVDFRSLQVAPASAAAAPPTSASSSTSRSSSSSASTAQLPPGVAVGPAGFPAEQFSFTFRGNFFHLSDFFNRLQAFVTATKDRISIRGRLMTVNAITFQPSPSGFPQIAADVSATAYVLPASQGLVAGASPMGPAGSGGTASAGSSSSTPTAAAAVITR